MSGARSFVFRSITGRRVCDAGSTILNWHNLICADQKLPARADYSFRSP
jgi:hypothetical protein